MNIKKKMSNKSIRGVIWHDIARGFYADRFRYLIAVLMLAGVLIILGNHEFGMMDTIFFIQGGYDPVLIIKEGKIVFPFVWMLIQFLVPFMIYSYCNDDCEGVGIDFLMKCRSRRLWWNSKCLWNCLTVLSVYAIQYATAFVYGLCNGNLSMKINYELFEKISNKSVPDNPANVWIIVYMLVMPVVVSLVTALVQMTISMFTNPMIGMLAVMAWNVMSVFINNPLMIGNNSMVVRSSVYNAQRIQVWQSVAVCLVVYIVVYVAGMIGFNKKDILVKKKKKMYIKITDVNKTRKKAPILRDINLEFTGGKVYGLRGKNGSGKTMLMRAICGLITPDSGIIDIDGKILGKDISFPESIGVLIENPSFIGNYTGLKNLKVLASIQNRAGDEQIRKALKDIGLDPDDKRTYRKYSLGMKQKLGIAAAVMENPDIIILDEPINALDDVSVEKVHDILEEQKKRGAVIIIACHDKEELDQLSDEIIEISDGRIINKTC